MTVDCLAPKPTPHASYLRLTLPHLSCLQRVGTLDYLAPEVLSQPTPDEVAAGRGGQLRPYDAKVGAVKSV